MRVKIVKCSDPTYWYSGYIGKDFDVISFCNFVYTVIEPVSKEKMIITKNDAEIVPDQPEPTLKIVQITSNRYGSESDMIYALCNDGSIWAMCDPMAEKKWIKLPEIPQD